MHLFYTTLLTNSEKSMFDRFVGMRVFVNVADYGSISAAGRALDMSPAMATKHLDALEARLGIKLAHRTTRQITITDAGNIYLQSCRRILQDLNEAEAELIAQRHEAVGTLHMNVPLSFGVRFIAPLLPEFSSQYPKVDVELGLSDNRLDLIEGAWDLGIRVGQLSDEPFKARKLGDCPMHVCASPKYLENYGTPQTVKSLSSHNCLSYSLSNSQGNGYWKFGREGNIEVPVKGNLMANNGDALLTAAIAGQGVIYQPSFIVDEAIKQGRLVSLTLDQPMLDLGGVHVLFHSATRPPAKVRIMVEYLKHAFQQQTYLDNPA